MLRRLNSALFAFPQYLFQRRLFIKAEQWWRYNRHYEAELDPYRILWIDPDEIANKHTRVVNKSKQYLTHVIGGDWDDEKLNIESFGQKGMLYQSMKAHFIDDVDWDQTIAYQKVVEGDAKWRGIDSEAEFQDRCEHVEELYQAIQSDGFKTQEELKGKKPRKPSEVKVAIGREGDFLYVNGKHRLLIAKLLSLDKIPVNVTLRHPQWQAYRDEIITNKFSKQISITATHYKDHPDIEYLI